MATENRPDESDNMEEKDAKALQSKFSSSALKLAVGAFFHPLQYVKVLIQVG